MGEPIPGPYEAEGEDVFVGATFEAVAEVYSGYRNTGDVAATARLLAASWELLEAAKQALLVIGDCACDTAGTPSEAYFKGECDKLRVVIATALEVKA